MCVYIYVYFDTYIYIDRERERERESERERERLKDPMQASGGPQAERAAEEPKIFEEQLQVLRGALKGE